MGSGVGSHSIMRSGPLADAQEGPSMLGFILIPWLLSVAILLITFLSLGSSWLWVVLPALLACGLTASSAWDNYKKGFQPMAIFYILCLLGVFSAFVMSLIIYIHFLEPYNELSGGATYLNVLPSQSALSVSDGTAIVFSQGTSVDTSRQYGYVDARNPDGTMYCVAPLSNTYMELETSVQFFAAGTDCCGKTTGFGCGQGSTQQIGALMLATEYDASEGYKNAVEGAAAHWGLQPGNGYGLLTMVSDPMTYRSDKLDSAVKILLIYTMAYLLIACMTGYMAYSQSNPGPANREKREEKREAASSGGPIPGFFSR